MLDERVFPADNAVLHEASAFVEEALEGAGFSMQAILQINIAVEEIFVNIANYAYGEGKGQVRLGIDTEGEMAEIRFTDWGVPFDPTARPDPDITLSAEERTIGGLGIFMVRQYMDEVSYLRRDGKNILTLRRKKG